MRLGILKSFREIDELVSSYAQACKYLNVDYVIIDIMSSNWIENIKKANVDGVLVRVKGNIQEHKSFFDERLAIIDEELHIPIYPSRKELFLYENKRLYAYWLNANNFPHPKSYVFYDKKNAIKFLDETEYPIVFKTSGGASASGVQIINSKHKAKRLVHKILGYFDARLTIGLIPWTFVNKWIPVPKFGQVQKNYIIIQEYIPIKWEWRIIKIGNSFFGHQKLLKGQFASGSGLVGWVKPPFELLDMVDNLCNVGKFDSMAMDVFEGKDGKYYINEIQSLFGSFADYQMSIDGKHGRFIKQGVSYMFEEGDFNIINSNVLRVEDFVKKLNSGYYL